MKILRKKQKGFTLIELLVVISVIGLLASVVLVSLNLARTKARDTKRIADLKQIYTALQMYYNDKGYLPTTQAYSKQNPGGWDYSSQNITGLSTPSFVPFLVWSGYLSAFPKDPLNNGTGDVYFGGSGYAYAYYCYESTGWPANMVNTLTLAAKLERPQDYPNLPINGSLYLIASNQPNYSCNSTQY